MRDIDAIYTRGGTPITLVLTRLLFLTYFIFSLWTLQSSFFSHSELTGVWLVYMLLLYLIAEYLYNLFMTRNVDLTFAMPLLFATYCLNLTTLLLGGQERLTLMNRAEHFAIFVLIGFIVWVFFIKYLPQDVWRDHPYYTALLVLSVTALAGVLNELAELTFDQVFGTNHVGRHLDTSLDLLMNTLGTGLFLAVRLIMGTLEKESTPPNLPSK